MTKVQIVFNPTIKSLDKRDSRVETLCLSLIEYIPNFTIQIDLDFIRDDGGSFISGLLNELDGISDDLRDHFREAVIDYQRRCEEV